MKNKKVIKNGKVAVAYSPSFGAGWVTCDYKKSLSPFEPKVIKMVQEGRQNEITREWCKKELGLEGIYCGGAKDLKIRWLPKGTKFRIDEYDGSEAIITEAEEDFVYIT